MTDDEIQALRKKAAAAPEGPWFVAPDEAPDAPDHARSGLALVDTGRTEDWPIARLSEWGAATYVAAVDPQTVLGLLDDLREARSRLGAYEEEAARLKAAATRMNP